LTQQKNFKKINYKFSIPVGEEKNITYYLNLKYNIFLTEFYFEVSIGPNLWPKVVFISGFMLFFDKLSQKFNKVVIFFSGYFIIQELHLNSDYFKKIYHEKE